MVLFPQLALVDGSNLSTGPLLPNGNHGPQTVKYLDILKDMGTLHLPPFMVLVIWFPNGNARILSNLFLSTSMANLSSTTEFEVWFSNTHLLF